jgi:hypothetical protein
MKGNVILSRWCSSLGEESLIGSDFRIMIICESSMWLLDSDLIGEISGIFAMN